MAGHSKWANIKHRKAAQDAKKGKAFTKVAKEIAVAAKEGGADPVMNSRLRLALDKAKECNLPKDNIERAIKKGSGEGNENAYEEITYEGYGPGGVAILIKALTDNRNRTVAEVRSTMNKKGGNMGEAGCVAWIFETKGIIEISKEKADEETLFELALELGAEDVKDEGDVFQVVTEVSSYFSVKTALEEKKYDINYSEVTMKPKNTISLGVEDLKKLFTITDALEDLDDVQEVFSNFDADEATMAAMDE
ncbi:YebC/PmpR family DNA-binding transcriptional regulator [Seleniivibrio woodruffii]|uniref:Probable transcriptional regulatory protein C8D98_0806 n=1 Tax=Seleniivibrio woodruffii TaxID=1078050 RepID=A0A4R1KCQ5_9BACT|nr:YebC/PmpR family DNA-binding transcriptional regulator [Seleniivibrio woodruffii]TCK62284.1 YebC/PmpR family DNA-binding regulatory protein [Seleniivibrio woodruffii]TVZ34598.1 YebC/PmpR family DNA-binding regulatory protein [Seleniivibrio woodruffii]